MSRVIVGFLLGALFAVGLVVSGMTRPDNVVAFLDIAGAWDPKLAVVMVGAIGVYLPAYLWMSRRDRPVFDEVFHWPTARGIDGRLIGGSALFGAGWGLSGFCPGPALVAIGAAVPSALWFGGGLFVGMGLFELWARRSAAEVGPVVLSTPHVVDG